MGKLGLVLGLGRFGVRVGIRVLGSWDWVSNKDWGELRLRLRLELGLERVGVHLRIEVRKSWGWGWVRDILCWDWN